MNVVLKNEQVCVIDDVLPAEGFAKLWAGLQGENFNPPVVSGTWHKVWRLTSGSPVWGTYRTARPHDYMSELWDALWAIWKKFPEYVTHGTMGLTPYVYPPGTKLPWHTDHGYGGALTYYAHPRWGSTWGGELMLAEVTEKKDAKLVLDHTWEDEHLMKRGVGQFIACKPNRAILQKPGNWHGMNRIDSDAGDNLRVSIQAFWR